MNSRTDRYIFPTGIAALGGILIAAPLFFQVPGDLQTYNAKQQTAQSEEINRHRISQRKKTAELIQQTGLLPEGRSLRITDYDNSNTRPRVKNSTLQSYLEDEVIYVYDRSNVCAGVIKQRKFIWKGDSSFACQGAPVKN